MRLKKYIVTVDIGGTKTNIGYFYNGKLEKIKKYPTDKFGPNNIRMITDILVNSKIHILAICLSLTGLIDKKGLWSPINKKTLGDFKNFPVIKSLGKTFGVPVYALGDTQAAALGEMYYGSGKKLKNFFYLTVSTGIGGSVIYDRNLFDNKVSDIGSVGHSVIKFNGKKCGCGKKGCLEAYSSGNAIFKRSRSTKCKNTKDLLTKFIKNSKTIKIIDEATSMIVQSMININMLLRIENFIIGGSVGLNPFFYKMILDNTKLANNSIKLHKAKLKSKPELYGCYVYINKKLFLSKS